MASILASITNMKITNNVASFLVLEALSSYLYNSFFL